MNASKKTNEIKLITACASLNIDNPDLEPIDHLLDCPLDWQFIITESKYHCILPLVFYGLNKTKRKPL